MNRLLFIISIFTLNASAQTPATWSAVAKKLNDSTYSIKITAKISKGWRLYATKDSKLQLDPVTLEVDGNPITLKGATTTIHDPVFGKSLAVYTNAISWSGTISLPFPHKFKVKGFAADDSTFIPFDDLLAVQGAPVVGRAGAEPLTTIDIDHPVSNCGGTATHKSKSLWTIFLLGFLGGMLALVTPCVFPMIPVTVSYFTKMGKAKRRGLRSAVLYGLSIIGIYLLASAPFHFMDDIDPQIFNTISTNLWVNLFFFVTFIIFALGLFGVFNFTLPSAMTNRVGSRSGIFFMALTLAIVSFSCTGPILGTLLVGALSSQGGAWQLTAGMLGFGVSLSLPFTIFALFPGWLRNLPKSGGWLETVKKSLAFIELALSLKFLSNADLTSHWGILKREIFIGLWIAIAIFLSLYLFGVFRRKPKSELYIISSNGVQKDRPRRREPGGSISAIRRIFGILTFFFALYLIPGLFGETLPLLSGFPPPLSYSLIHHKNDKSEVSPRVINNFDQAIELAKRENKPVLIDFTGWACVNCRKMEENVWTDPKVSKIINKKFILVSLYVDDRKTLVGDAFNTVGEKWASFEQQSFRQVSQPLYAIVSPEGKLLNSPIGYTPAAANYLQWLRCGLSAEQETGNVTEK